MGRADIFFANMVVGAIPGRNALHTLAFLSIAHFVVFAIEGAIAAGKGNAFAFSTRGVLATVIVFQALGAFPLGNIADGVVWALCTIGVVLTGSIGDTHLAHAVGGFAAMGIEEAFHAEPLKRIADLAVFGAVRVCIAGFRGHGAVGALLSDYV